MEKGNHNQKFYMGRGKRKRMISCINNITGYMQAHITINGTRKTYTVHRLVAICFIPNPNNYKQVNHIDGNKLNNHVSNLEWCTCKQNIRKGWELGLYQPNYGEKNANAKIKEADVIEIFRLRNIEKWTQQRIADKFGISQQCVGKILRRERWKHVERK